MCTNNITMERIHTSDPAINSAIDRSIPEFPAADIQAEDDYFHHNPPPPYLPSILESVDNFIKYHQSTTQKRRIVLVTSGGTTVPLENNTVRFIDNFSAGTRGATSAEYFLENNYAVIFLHREFSLLPYSRHYSHTTNCFLDYMIEDSKTGNVIIDLKYQNQMKEILKKYQNVKEKNLLINIPFTTVNQYLFTLKIISESLNKIGTNALLYLAAAVSDFFLPHSKMPKHKIQSSKDHGGTGKLVIDLEPVPKFLRRVVDNWAPKAMIVSFKLETDDSILIKKSRYSLERYGHELVIGNLLQTRKKQVIFVTTEKEEIIKLNDEQLKNNVDIESIIIPKVIELQDNWKLKFN